MHQIQQARRTHHNKKGSPEETTVEYAWVMSVHVIQKRRVIAAVDNDLTVEQFAPVSGRERLSKRASTLKKQVPFGIGVEFIEVLNR